MAKKPKLDARTLRVLRRMLAMPPKLHEDMKVGRPQVSKKRGPKGRAVSAKRRTA
jgi:hypothetical protein